MKINNLTKIYDNGNNEVLALNNFSFHFPSSGLVFITGKSGSGKSTLLYLISEFLKPTNGTIEWDNQSNSKKEIGFVFQNYNLFNDFTVSENIKIPLIIKGLNYENDEIKKRLTSFGVQDLIDTKVFKLSGGEQQRVSVARAVISNPEIILADEPTGNLDKDNAIILNNYLKEISKTKLVIYVTHDLETANKFGDIIINLSSGSLDNVIYNNKIDETKSTSLSTEEIKPKNKRKLFILELLFSFKFLFSKKIRFILSLFSLIISSLLLLMSFSLSDYDTNSIIYNYFKDYNVKDYTLYEEKSYYGLFDELISNKIYLGEDFYNNLLTFVEKENISKVSLDKYSSSILQKFNIFAVHDIKGLNILFKDKLEGNEKGEIIISDYLSITNNLVLGDKIVIDNFSYEISSIFLTDYIQNNYLLKKASGRLSLIDSYNEKYYYLAVYVNSSIFENNIMEKNTIMIESNYLMENPTFNISNSLSINVKSINSLGSLYAGVFPSDKNEILVSKEYAYQFKILDDENNVILKILSFYNYNKDEFNEAYSNLFDIYSYFPTGVKIVGVVDDEFDNIYINDDIFSDIKLNYFNSFYYNEFRIMSDKIISKNVLNSLSSNMFFDEPGVRSIYSFSKTLRNIFPILITLSILFFILSLFMLITLFLNSFYNGKKDIAILKCLGMNNKGVNNLFLFQCFEVILLSIIGFFLLYLISIPLINIYFYSIFPIRKINIYIFDYKSFIYSIVVIIATSLLCFLLNKKKTLSDNIIDTLKKE
jgi:ABC-type lipoprotein export system ATPase subunit